MNDFERALHQEAKVLSLTISATPEALLTLTHAGYRACAKEGNLRFPDENRYALLHEVLHHSVSWRLYVCCLPRERCLREIRRNAGWAHPRYACTQARVQARRSRYGRPCL